MYLNFVFRWQALATQRKDNSTFEALSASTTTEPEYAELEREVDSSYKPISQLLEGRRIVRLGHVLQEYEKLIRHSDICTMGRMIFTKETRFGMNSRLHFFCDNCERRAVICTDPHQEGNSLSEAIVWGNLSIGIGRNQCEELFSLMDIPFIAEKTYSCKILQVKKIWEKHMFQQMQKAGEEEREIAVHKGNLCADGTPYITVIVDGGWSKRSYGHGYNAASGVGIIIGAETKKPLFLGVRNKTCSACSYCKNRNIPVTTHNCALNYTGPSTGMEQDIIVEGFSRSVQHHGLIYKYLIGDGDSSVYAKIVEKVAYGRQVIKIECANHMTRCLSDKLHKLSSNTSFAIINRKALLKKDKSITNVERLVKSVRTIVKNNKSDPASLRRDLANAPYHVLGNHENCRDTFCTRRDIGEEDLTKQVSKDFFLEILKIVEPMVNKADRLAYNQTTNQAERYMALVAKCTGGKRINFSRSISYTTRAYGAAISHSLGPAWHLHAWKGPIGTNMERVLKRKDRKHEMRRCKPAIRRIKRKNCGPDSNYGPNAAEPDISENDMTERKAAFLEKLKNRVSTPECLQEIEEKTRGQHDSHYWRELRTDYLTASNFGSVVKRKLKTPCHNLVKNLLYRAKELNTPGIIYGRLNEKKAIEKYEMTTGVSVKRCGFFIDPDHPFLGASPDGLVGENGLIEIKCLPSIKGKLRENKKRHCYSNTNDGISLKPMHNYYYQVQGQLNILKKDFCDFVIFTEDDFHIERIIRNDDLWSNVMLPKLTTFYMNCILPEILDGRIPRGLKVRETA